MTILALVPLYITWAGLLFLGVVGALQCVFESRGNELWVTALASSISLALSAVAGLAIRALS